MLAVLIRIVGILAIIMCIVFIIGRRNAKSSRYEKSVGFFTTAMNSIKSAKKLVIDWRQKKQWLKSLKGKKVLVVEPDEKTRKILKWNFASLGSDVRAVSSGIAAAKAINSFSPDILIVNSLLNDTDAADVYSLADSKCKVIFVGVVPTQKEKLIHLGDNVVCISKSRSFDVDNIALVAGKMVCESCNEFSGWANFVIC